jgi:hypothetical protein
LKEAAFAGDGNANDGTRRHHDFSCEWMLNMPRMRAARGFVRDANFSRDHFLGHFTGCGGTGCVRCVRGE